jgi:hypothetical protein
VNPWSTLTPEEYAVMITAQEEGQLIHVLDAWRARTRWAETGTTSTPSDLTDDMKRELFPIFEPIVADLVDRGLLMVKEYMEDQDRFEVHAGERLRVALRDPACWIWRMDMCFRFLKLTTTDAWERSTRAVE